VHHPMAALPSGGFAGTRVRVPATTCRRLLPLARVRPGRPDGPAVDHTEVGRPIVGSEHLTHGTCMGCKQPKGTQSASA
jgi:hypothetical protein